jgi:ASC-1-like (ASCH) protein
MFIFFDYYLRMQLINLIKTLKKHLSILLEERNRRNTYLEEILIFNEILTPQLQTTRKKKLHKDTLISKKLKLY